MTREEAVKTLQELLRETNDSWYEETYKMAIEALEQEPCEDNRDKFLKEFIEYAKSEFDYDIQLHPKNMSATEVMEKMFGDIYYIIKNASSVVPSREELKHGKWIAIDDTHSQCMECGATFCITSSNEWEVNYCPNCGARVEVEEE